jgi:hypothetical protein
VYLRLGVHQATVVRVFDVFEPWSCLCGVFDRLSWVSLFSFSQPESLSLPPSSLLHPPFARSSLGYLANGESDLAPLFASEHELVELFNRRVRSPFPLP